MMGPGMSRQKFIAIAAQVIIGWDAIQAVGLFASRCSTSAFEYVFEFLPIFLEDLFLRRFRRRLFAPLVSFHLRCGLRSHATRLVPAKHMAQIVPVEPKQKSHQPNRERSDQKQREHARPAFLALLLARHGTHCKPPCSREHGRWTRDKNCLAINSLNRKAYARNSEKR